MNNSKDKQEIRGRIKRLRFAHPLAERDAKSREIEKKLFSLDEFKKAEIVSIYISSKEEVETKNIIRKGFKMGKKIAVPSLKNNNPCMCLIDKNENPDNCTPFLKNNKKIVKTKELNLILVPGLAFDEKCRRLGRGKGYYDMFLKEAKGKIPLIALAYDFQILEEIPIESHDVSMDKVITNKRIIS